MTDHVVEVQPARPGAGRLTVVDSSLGAHLFGLAELPSYRELLMLLAWRDIKVRYKQTLIGVGWAVIQPLLTMIVFTIVFSRVAHISSGGRPYPVLVFVGLLPWQLFSQAVTRSTASLVSNNSLVSKIYFPRVIIPVAAIGSPLFDFVISLGILAILMGVYGVAPGWGIVALPLFVALTLLASLAAGLWMSALNARFRDIGYAIPFALQIALYLTPVAYPLSAVPAKWRTLFELNPMAEFVQGFRWGLIGDTPPNWALLGVGSVVVVVFLVWGLSYFARTEQTLADVI